jgi:AcrR family transcriptional regulator
LTASKLAPAPRTRAGRPTRDQAEQRRGEVLDCALEVFLERGYEQATVDLIAARAGASKRTLYVHYEDKTALFRAAVLRAIERYAADAEKILLVEGDDLEETLTALGRLRLAHVISPVGQRLQRILNAESYRFPDIFNLAYEQGTRPMIDFIADVLRRRSERGELAIDEPARAAAVFLSMVVGGPARLIGAGGRMSEAEIEERVRFSVRLFLNGARARP